MKLALNKPNELPEGYSKFKEDELKKSYCQKKVNLFNHYNKFLFGFMNDKEKINKKCQEVLDRQKYYYMKYNRITEITILYSGLFNEKCQEILDRQKYYYMKYNRITEITILYSGLFNEIKLFGKEFVDKNKRYCSIKINGKEYKLTEKIPIENEVKDNILEIKLKGIHKVTDMRFMFYSCNNLIAE